MNSLKSQVHAALAKLGNFESPTPLSAEFGGQNLTCELVALDSLACAFNQFSLQSDPLAKAPLTKLKMVAEDLSRRLTYLMEPITPVEVDAEGCMVQMRSNPPQKDDNTTTYYELLVKRAGLLSLQRFTRQRGVERVRVPAQVTREVFLRLVDDFSKAAA
jgi:hypothetical protein